MLDALELGRFEPIVGESFELLPEDGTPIPLELSAVHRGGELSSRQAEELGKRLPFSLVFRGPADLRLPQGVRALRHPELGELSIFLVQLDQTADGSVFEAVFT